MAKSKIGFGKCSSLFLYILGNSLFRFFKECLFNFNFKNKTGLFGFKPIFLNHNIIANIYMYLSYIIFGLLSLFILNKIILGTNSKKENQRSSLVEQNLIYNDYESMISYRIFLQILLVCLIFILHADLIKMLYLFDISTFDIWTFDIFFSYFFMKKYFVTNIYKHQKFSLILIVVICTSLLIISTFFKDSDLNAYEKVKQLTGFYSFSILIFLGFMLISCMTSFGRVLSKMLMNLKFISPYKIIFDIGLFGVILNSIILLITTLVKCETNNYSILENFCTVKDGENSYYDNILVYFYDLRKSSNYEFYIEIFVLIPIYLILNFLEFACEILIIYYLNPNFILIRDNLYYGISKIMLISYNLTINKILWQLIILELAEIFAVFGYLVYLEIIELRFCGFDENLKRKIIIRAEGDTLGSLMFEDNDESDDENSESRSRSDDNEQYNRTEMENINKYQSITNNTRN